MNKTSSYDYHLPHELIAQNPATERDASRLLRLSRAEDGIGHHEFRELPDLLRPGDMLILNDTMVFKARLYGKKMSGSASVEIFCLEPTESDRFVWRALVRPGNKLRVGSEVELTCGFLVTVREHLEDGIRLVELPRAISPWELFERCGHMPLPHYISRTDAPDDRYQTVYADRLKERSVAAPTAGLHFTNDLLWQLRSRGIDYDFITLDVGIGTFRPVKAEEVASHKMHSERCAIDENAAMRINARKKAGGRIVAVGTTVVRTLESFASPDGEVAPGAAATDIFITPGYDYRVVDALITNFHLPRSTLLMLVCAFAGYERVMAAYREAVESRYRFFSYGDAMLIE